MAANDEVEVIKGEAISYEVGYQSTISSKVLSEERELFIHLPKDYDDSGKSYPVIYLLDGNGHFRHATTSVEYMQSQGLMPNAIVVGITNEPGQRSRDLGEGSNNFWSYIKSEVVPFINNNYRASGHKTIFGHSMAGAFVMRGLLNDSTWFDSYIAASPGMEIEMLTDYKSYFNAKNKKLSDLEGRSFFYSMADISAEGKENVEIASQLETLLKEQSQDNFSWGYRFLPQQIHMTTPPITFYEGITQTFLDYQAPAISTYKAYIEQGGMEGLKDYYQKRAAKYQTQAGVPDRTVRRVGIRLFADGHKSEAIDILINNTKTFPNSIFAHNSLARLYDENKQPVKSLLYFEKALKLAKEQGSRATAYLEGEIKRVKNTD